MNTTESHAHNYFSKHGFSLTKIPEREIKTPDFESELFLAEVKQITPDEVEGVSNDSTYNAVKNNLRDAARKFRAYDPSHNKKHIVVVYSDEIVKDDIYSVWTGEWSQEHRDRIFKGGMLLSKEHKQQIDAIAWFEKESDTKPRFVWVTSMDLMQFFPEISR